MRKKIGSIYMDSTHAFSEDGYIIDQRYTMAFDYGRFSSNYNGCAWIAAYNLLLARGIQPDNNDIRSYMGTRLRFSGFLGTRTSLLCEYLNNNGLPVTVYKGKNNILHVISKCSSGIIRYCDPIYPHFVAFVRSGSKYRFFNADPGNPFHILDIEEFLKQYCKLPLIKLITNI